ERNFSCGMWAETDENGIWKNETVPPELIDEQSNFRLSHPDFMDASQRFAVADFLPNENGRFVKTMTMRPGVTVSGRVVDENGKPVEGAVVVGEYRVYGNAFDTITDENGGFTFRNWSETRSAYLGAWKKGKMATLKSIAVTRENMPPVELVMKPAGKPVAIRIVDKDGKPVEGFYIAIERWGNHRLVSERLLTGTPDRPRTDAEGRWVWPEAPDGEVTFDMFLGDRYMDVRGKTVTPRDGEYEFVSNPALVVTGRAIDSETGKPITGFDATLGIGFAGSTQTSWQTKQSVNTEYRLSCIYPYDHYVVKLEAPGHKPALSRKINVDEGNVTIDLTLEKLDAEATPGIAGKVCQPDGTPAAGASVAMATLSQSHPYVQNGRLPREEEPYTVRTNDNGEFRFPYIDFEQERQSYKAARPGMEPPRDYLLVILHASGCKQVTQEEMQAAGKAADKDVPITLEPWAEIRGTVKTSGNGTGTGKKPLQVGYNITRLAGESDDVNRNRWEEPRIYYDYSATCDADGRFVIAKVPAGEGTVSRTVVFADRGSGWSATASHAEKITLLAGETTQVTIGGTGRPVKGKLLIPDDFGSAVDWNFGLVRLTPKSDLTPPDFSVIQKLQETIPKEIVNEADMEKRKELFERWRNETEEGKKYKETLEEHQKQKKEYLQKDQENRMRGCACAIGDDGSFQVDGIFAGDWTLELELHTPPPANQCGYGDRIGELTHNLTVDEIPGGVSDEPLDLGELTIKKVVPPKPMPQPGDTAPDFKVRRIFPIAGDAKTEDTSTGDEPPTLQLSDFRGKYVVLDFWATWCGPCLANLPELKKLHEKYKDNEQFALIGVSLDEANQAEMLGRFVSKREMSWLHVLAGGWNADVVRDYHVNAIPCLFVVDPEGKILMTNPNIGAIDEKLGEIFSK
ncbi:MAG: carboxypeptidase regulatory-like domain-containing protein, partial [Planctomycetaceae bacterium]|nr:carboxypeptidase regulatory-like domain-containing protein [Planctomycetaceae bacterium]